MEASVTTTCIFHFFNVTTFFYSFINIQLFSTAVTIVSQNMPNKEMNQKSHMTLIVCTATQCWQRQKELLPLEKWLGPNEDARRLDGADSLPGRSWGWDKYCRVIESLWLFPVRQNIQTKHRLPLHHNPSGAWRPCSCSTHVSSKKKTYLSIRTISISSSLQPDI